MEFHRPDVDQYLFRRASKRLYNRYQVNTEELHLLIRLSGYSFLVGREIVRLQLFRNSYSAGRKDKMKIEQITWHCTRKGWIGSYEYILQPGSRCIGLTDVGKLIISDYYKTVAELAATIKPAKMKIPVDRWRQVA